MNLAVRRSVPAPRINSGASVDGDDHLDLSGDAKRQLRHPHHGACVSSHPLDQPSMPPGVWLKPGRLPDTLSTQRTWSTDPSSTRREASTCSVVCGRLCAPAPGTGRALPCGRSSRRHSTTISAGNRSPCLLYQPGGPLTPPLTSQRESSSWCCRVLGLRQQDPRRRHGRCSSKAATSSTSGVTAALPSARCLQCLPPSGCRDQSGCDALG
jgi:hypothetical protein